MSTTDVVMAIVGADGSYDELKACEQVLHRWRVSGAVTPSIAEARGAGSRVRWSTADLWRLRRIWEMRQTMRSYEMCLSNALVRDMWDSLYEGRTPPLERPAELALNA